MNCVTALVVSRWIWFGLLAPGSMAATRYRDYLIRIRIDSNDETATAFFKQYKETLKAHFRQIDIWITAHEIEII